MKLFLVRHGEYIPENINPEKPLSDKGRNDIEKLGQKLKDKGYKVNEIFHSGKLRAKQTAEILEKHVLMNGEISEQEGLNPDDDIKPWAEKINNYSGDLMLVGHLPFMAKLSSFLINNTENEFTFEFNPGTTAVLSKSPEGKWILEQIFQP
jgi:phosphohistidine phosphatase